MRFAKGQILTRRNPKRPRSRSEANSRNLELELRTVYIRQLSTSKEPPYDNNTFCRLDHPYLYRNHEFYTFRLSLGIRS